MFWGSDGSNKNQQGFGLLRGVVLHCIMHPRLQRGPPHSAAFEQLNFHEHIFITPLL